MPIFIDKYRILVSNQESDIIFAKENKMKKVEINKEDDPLEDTILKGIISSCENMLDDLEQGANIEEKDMQDIIYADNVLLDIQQRLSEQLKPTNINSSQDEWNIAPMTDRIYSDDEHGNAL